MDAVDAVAERHGLAVIEDCAHALGASYKGRTIGSNPNHVSVFSFHPTKNITTGEGGMVCTGLEDVAERIAILRQHGMSKGAWQLGQLDAFNARRTAIVERYRAALSGVAGLTLPSTPAYGFTHAWHIFTPMLDLDRVDISRDEFMALMKAENIGTAYHYQAVHLFEFYRKTFGFKPGDFPNAEKVSERILSLPLFPSMADSDVEDVIEAVTGILKMHVKGGVKA
jgi:dTDP-4-amino-4,6-dideoxygalactose transaminase